MAILRRNKAAKADVGDGSGSVSSEGKDKKMGFAQRKPANTAFKQQRLKAWQPILTPKTVLPMFFLIGIVFAPIGAVLYYFARQVSEFTLDYTQCKNAGAQWVTMPGDKYDYQLHGVTPTSFQSPRWRWVANDQAPNRFACDIQFSVPEDLQPSLFMYYKLTNYYQNHRRYVKSIDTNQLLGDVVALKDLGSGNCKPLGTVGDSGSPDYKGIYPCGLIANSMFNDTFSDPVLLNVAGSSAPNQTYTMSEKGIVWPGEKKKYGKTTQPASELTPPPFWRGNFSVPAPYSFPTGYTDENIFDPSDDEHFMVWMRTAGLPTFRKLYKRNDNDVMRSGSYSITIFDNYPVDMFDGTKSIVFSTVSWVGGRSVFLGIAYIAVAALSILLGLAFTARHLIRPRKLGDLSLLSWND